MEQVSIAEAKRALCVAISCVPGESAFLYFSSDMEKMLGI